MATYLNELPNMKLFKRKFFLPINEKDKRHGSTIFLLTPDYLISKELMTSPLVLNINRSFESYYIEPNINYMITQESSLISGTSILKSNSSILQESIYYGSESEYKVNTLYGKEYESNDNYIQTENMIYFDPKLNDQSILEASNNSSRIKRLVYKERIRTNKEALIIYKKVKQDNKWIRKTFLTLDRYKESNLFIDLYHYNRSFLKNNTLSPNRSMELYFDFLTRFITDSRIEKNGYKQKTIFIPVHQGVWNTNGANVWDHMKTLNPISMITRYIKNDKTELVQWKNIDIVFIGNNGYFKINTKELDDITYPKFISLIKRLYMNEPIMDDQENIDSPKAIKTKIINKLEDSQNIKIYNLTGEEETISKKELDDKIKNSESTSSEDIKKDLTEKKKKELVKSIDKVANQSATEDQAIEALDNDYVKNLIKDLAADEDNSIKISATRAARMRSLNDKFLNTKIENVSIKDLLQKQSENTELPETSLPIDTINDEWKHLKATNFEKVYDINEDIMAMLHSFSSKSAPFSIVDINIEDTSTTEDYINTYTVKCEDANGKRFTLVFDVPKFRNNRFMKLRGNDKVINGQLVLLPVIKTDEDTVQIVSSYNKIFIRRYGSAVGKSFPVADCIIKALNKYKGTDIKVTTGDNKRICSKYELPIDYIDLASVFSKIEVKGKGVDRYTIHFNQDELRENYKIDDQKGIPFAIMKTKSGQEQVLYFDQADNTILSNLILAILRLGTDFEDTYSTVKPGSKYTYSKASILNTEIPLIIIMAYSEGLITAMKKGKVTFDITEKRPTHSLERNKDFIKFKDAYIEYNLDYISSLLMNGLKECPTEEYSIKEINSKAMWLDFLDQYGGRIKADGLDNFYDLTMDPITVDICKIYNLPTDYIELLGYANMLLSDNKYNKHVDITGNRYRTNELIAVDVYKALCKSYADYTLQLKRNRKDATMTIKKSAIIDLLMQEKTMNDLSIFSPLMEVETANAVSFKGPSGMNSERSYGLDKRIYDDSMINVLAMSTGFAANVGLTRQATIDMNITGKRGLIKKSYTDDMGVTKSLSITEALTPFGTTRDDPFRTAMTFIQTSKHSMRVKNSSPLLITNGADEALPYMVSDMFAFKAKDKGTVVEITDQYMKIEYDNGTNDFVDLREQVKKNSDGGVYETLKLDTDLKPGAKVKPGDILAYDKLSFSNKIGSKQNLAADIGTFCKMAILNTDEGYEDSAIISEWLSDAMSSEVVIKKEVFLPKNTNVYNMVSKGQPIQEGDPLLIFQRSFDEEDFNVLLRNITVDGDEVTDLGRIPIKSKVTGVVQDIKIYRTAELNELSPSLKRVVTNYEKEIKALKKASEGYVENSNAMFDPDYKLEATGKMKNANDQVLIEFYLKYNDKMSVGDKLVYYSALKGVTKDIFPEGEEPYSEFRGPDEKVDTLLSVGSVNGRMVGSIIATGCINKILIELDRKVKDIMGIKYDLNGYKK